METVCLALEKDNKLFAVGSQSHVSFYEPRCGTAVGYIGSRDPGAGESRGRGWGQRGRGIFLIPHVRSQTVRCFSRRKKMPFFLFIRDITRMSDTVWHEIFAGVLFRGYGFFEFRGNKFS